MERITVFFMLSILALGASAQSSSNAPLVQSSSNAPAVQSSSNAPAVQSSSNAPAVPSSSNAPAVQSSSNVPAVQSSSNVPAVQSSSNVPAVQSSSNVPAVQSSSNAPAVQSSSNAPAVQSSSNAPAVQSSSNDPLVQSSSSVFTVQASPTQMPGKSTQTASITAKHSNIVSTTASPTRSPTPPLPSVMSSHSMVAKSSPVSSISTPFKPFITPSRTAQIASETVHLYDNGRPCLFARVKADFVISYNTTNTTRVNGTSTNTTVVTMTKIPLNGLNATINITGSCSFESGLAHFVMRWNERGNTLGPQHKFAMHFKRKINETYEWTVPSVSAVFNTSDAYAFPKKPTPSEREVKANASGLKFFGVGNNNSNYFCNAERDLAMSSGVTAKFKDVVLQPFSSHPKPVSNGRDCAADKSSGDDDDDDNTVPIAVGAALGGLVLIVLIAYVIGRRRSTSGYEQV
ncbi:lysosome-associated membrane glycoprotein 1-like [Dendronephthya gigantea]|uniref:lysosome-associated membrane glycoprotein 1-like n=1 Tax=Dendronephthya gigantea TaxID=151771 RepID=UPI00106BB261|nr:lysosome-associated membrane glycoprotein 1-like [Dendronephthya gigantea]